MTGVGDSTLKKEPVSLNSPHTFLLVEIHPTGSSGSFALCVVSGGWVGLVIVVVVVRGPYPVNVSNFWKSDILVWTRRLAILFLVC